MMSEEPSTAILPEASPSGDPWRRNHLSRKERLPRACTSRSAARFYPDPAPAADRRSAAANKEEQPVKCGKIVTPLVGDPLPSEIPQRELRSMWELASVLHFLHTFRPFLNIGIEFSAEELESALITPNGILDDIHIPLLRAIPPITRMALGRATWVTVLCRKLRDWWQWVADGEVPIVASHGTEVETYKMLDPGTRVRILKALCDIRVEQEDIRSYIDNSVKRGIPLSAFRKERVGGDSHGTSFWYEDDPIIGHRLYREIRKVEVKKVKARGVPSLPIISCQWETVATNLDEFQDVSEKLVSSKNRIEAALGKRLKIDVIPEVEKIHKRKEKLLKKQHREALLLDSFLTADGLASGRSLRDRKPVTYTFDDYDRSIDEAIKITKKRQTSPEPAVRREVVVKAEASINGRWNGTSHAPQRVFNDTPSPKSTDYEETDGEQKSETLDRTNRRRQRPQRYSAKEYVEAISDNEADFDSDDDIVGEAVYDDEYLRSRKHRKASSSSEGDEEYRWEEENAEEEEEEEDDSLSVSEDVEEPRRSKTLPSRSRRGMKLRSVDEIQSGLRRSKRATRNRIDYRQYEMSDSEGDSAKASKSNASDGDSDASNNVEDDSVESQDSQADEGGQEMENHQPTNNYIETVDKEQDQNIEKVNSPVQEVEVVRKRRFLDLNELAPGTGFDDGPSTTLDGEDTD
ncbi:DDT domain-containing protein DDR4 isoform X1 [Cinnamomum micranthum f. kanehirae]|uniref:DDT domain-containing protein DDR4 isoform X1 n=1 Tax=Cinnamomum micranthum f. kanehirae TaxID=337451 RepID=A0A443NWB1_9MAGN|nr:DDT domain-containing protein DDR4 isoform X1 [Cinnamomum micranthum f. kanehirae]